MLSRRQFLASSAVALGALPRLVRAAPAASAVVRLGLVADAQYADLPPAGTRHYRASLGKLRGAVGRFDALELDGCVNLGDLVDQGWDNFDAPLAILAASRHRWHHLLGNHDFSVDDARKEQVPARLALARRHYHLDVGAFRFAMLDTNDVATYAAPRATPAHERAAAELARWQARGAAQAKTWNGAVGPEQLAWLERTIGEAAVAGRKVVVFAHHPVFPANAHNLWNCDEVRRLVTARRSVVAWINGHNHAGNFGEEAGVPFVTLPGMVETADTTAFAVAEFHPDRLVLQGYGRTPSRTVPLRRA